MTPVKLCVFQKAIICAEKKIPLHPPVYISPAPLFDRGGIKQAAQQWLNDPPGGFFILSEFCNTITRAEFLDTIRAGVCDMLCGLLCALWALFPRLNIVCRLQSKSRKQGISAAASVYRSKRQAVWCAYSSKEQPPGNRPRRLFCCHSVFPKFSSNMCLPRAGWPSISSSHAKNGAV